MELKNVAGEKWVVTLSGEVDADNCAAVSEGLLADKRIAPTLELDVSGLTFLDSSGISALLRVKSDLEADGHDLKLISPTASVRRVLEITGLLGVFGLEESA